MLNQQTIARTGGAIWKELPKVDLPKETFTHLFTQHTVVKEKTTETVSTNAHRWLYTSSNYDSPT